jgi:hypothetical protein
MSNVSDCQTCGSSNLLINIWGFPIENALHELEKSGYEVNLMGCEPLDFPGFARHQIALNCNSIGDVFTLLNQEHDTKVLLVEQKLAFARRVGKDFHLTEKGQMASGELEQLTDKLI